MEILFSHPNAQVCFSEILIDLFRGCWQPPSSMQESWTEYFRAELEKTTNIEIPGCFCKSIQTLTLPRIRLSFPFTMERYR